MRRHSLIGVCLVLALAATACQDQKSEPMAPSVAAAPQLSASAVDQPKVALDQSALPFTLDAQYGTVAQRAINPGDFVCSATPLLNYLNGTITDALAREPDILITLLNLAADQVPTIDAIVYETEATPQSFGYTGEYTQRLTKTEKDLKRFWEIESADIQLIGMHGTMLLDVDRVARVYEDQFTIGGQPISHELALQLAQTVHDALAASQIMDGGNWPLFSFNSFAVRASGGSPAKVVMGDGVMEAYKTIGFDDVAPEAVYAHEFGHQVQFAKGYFNDPIAVTGTAPERTRYTELMADAFGAYYLTHKRGAALTRKRVTEFLQVYFNVGDCSFTNSGHHGTPNQRMRAAMLGFDIADQAQKQGHILSPDEFHALFVAAYPSIIAPDAT